MTAPFTKPIPTYQCHKRVQALKIAHVIANPRGHELHFEDASFVPMQVSMEWINKHTPHAGGYIVWYEDNYVSFSPAAAFEAGYTLVEDAAPDAATFQSRVKPWMLECFGEAISADRIERNHRFLEEALELVQSLGCTEDEAILLVRYVYGRPVGNPSQEVGGVMVTLAALCLAAGLDMRADGETELARILRPEIIEKIRAKQAAKPKHSPLPGVAPVGPSQDDLDALLYPFGIDPGDVHVGPATQAAVEAGK